MAGDYTRFTFDPHNRYSSVLMQQGRVQLDSDWNEQARLIDRRVRVQAQDTFGFEWVPENTTPDAFRLTAMAGPPVDFALGVGRMYVRGLLAEIFEGETPTYLVQPFYPDPPPLPANGPAIAYLDVWEREITYIDNEALLEIALGGPDTATRKQVVWQAKIQALDDAACDTDLDALFPPSAGRLTTQAFAPPPSNDPCILSPTGGYRGLENRLYRVEVHTPGGLGTARFMWSRDNASIVSRVRDITSSAAETTLHVDRIGRDGVLRFAAGDWVEVTDDHRELMGESGEIAQIAAPPDEAALTITLDRVIPQGAGRAFGGNADEIRGRHTKIKRWDQTVSNSTDPGSGVSQVDAASGLIPITTNPIELEDGVRVRFALAGAGEFHIGDYWVFAARTADGSVELLDEAPPRGILHHYAHLGVITDLTGGTDPEDCRNLQPECCGGCCTVNVEPGESIQAAIDSLPDIGGCVCLKNGEHLITAPIVIGRSNVMLIGEAPAVRVVGEGLPVMLQIGGVQGMIRDILVEHVRFELRRAVDESLIALLQACQRVRIRGCGLHYTGTALAQVVGMIVIRSNDVELVHSTVDRCYVGVQTFGLVQRLSIARNLMRGLRYQLTDTVDFPLAITGVDLGSNADAQCRTNRVEDFLTAFRIGTGADPCVIGDNDIRRGALPADLDAPQDLNAILFAIVVQGDRSVIEDNSIDLAARSYGGIRVLGRGDIVFGNRIESTVDRAQLGPIGIWMGGTGDDTDAGDESRVAENRLDGLQFAVLASRVAQAEIVANTIVQLPSRQGLGIWANDAAEIVVARNHIQNVSIGLALTNGERNRASDNVISATAVGLAVQSESALELSGNVIEDAANGGIAVLNAARALKLTHNRIAHCAYRAADLAVSIGILQFGIDLDVVIESCEVLNTGVSPDAAQSTGARSLGIAGGILTACQIANNRVAYEGRNALGANLEHRALLLVGPLSFRIVTGAAVVEVGQGGALINGNVFQGPGRTNLVELQRIVINDNIDLRFEKVTFGTNRCEHVTAAAAGQVSATVLLFGTHMIVTGNHVKAPAGVNSFNLGNRPRVAVLGNITTGAFIGVNTTVPTPHTNFNVQI
jgi:hypothetical protein